MKHTKAELVKMLKAAQEETESLKAQLEAEKPGTQKFKEIRNALNMAREKAADLKKVIASKVKNISVPKPKMPKPNWRKQGPWAVIGAIAIVLVAIIFVPQLQFVDDVYNEQVRHFTSTNVNGVEVVHPVGYEMKEDGFSHLSNWAASFDVEAIIVGGSIADNMVVWDDGATVNLNDLIKSLKNPATTVSFLDNPSSISIPGLKYTSTGDFQIYQGRHMKMGFIPSISKTVIVKSDNIYGHLTEEGMKIQLKDWTMENVSE
jgi:hypothetical protein